MGIRESLKLILENDFELILVEDGLQCIDCLENASENIGLILMDIKMPKFNGLEILEKIKEKWPEQKIIIITGYRSVETATEAVRLGASGYIVKPFKSEEILSSVRSAMK
jgi:DNA-binding NtrC family response regulator